LKQFSSIGGVTPIGGQTVPHGVAHWHSVNVREVLGVGPSTEVRIPVRAKGDLLVHLTLFSAAAEECFKPRRTYELEMSGYESGPDYGKKPGKFRRDRVLLPAVYTRELVVQEEPVSMPEYGYALEVPLGDQPTYGRRMARIVPNVVTEHLASGGYAVGVPNVMEYETSTGRKYVKLDFSNSPVDLHSPGGTVTFSIAKDIWEVMLRGDVLSVQMFKRLMQRVKESVVEFATSDAFSVWGSPWLSILRTCADDAILNYVRSVNGISWLVSFLAGLWKRYVDGMYKAVADSHQVANFWADLAFRFTRTRRLDVRTGTSRLPRVAQSEEFHQRLYDIREQFSQVLLRMEEHEMFDPTRVSDIQKLLPIGSRVSNGLHDGLRRGRIKPISRSEKNRLIARFNRFNDGLDE
jgi:hypothetical protein